MDNKLEMLKEVFQVTSIDKMLYDMEDKVNNGEQLTMAELQLYALGFQRAMKIVEEKTGKLQAESIKERYDELYAEVY